VLAHIHPGKNHSLNDLSSKPRTPGFIGEGHVWTAPWQDLYDVDAAWVGCGYVSDLLMRRGSPLAIS
jgi:hypothetical protein